MIWRMREGSPLSWSGTFLSIRVTISSSLVSATWFMRSAMSSIRVVRWKSTCSSSILRASILEKLRMSLRTSNSASAQR